MSILAIFLRVVRLYWEFEVNIESTNWNCNLLVIFLYVFGILQQEILSFWKLKPYSTLLFYIPKASSFEINKNQNIPQSSHIKSID